MGKRNKIRYQSKPKDKVTLILSGKIFLRLRDEDDIALGQKGDLMLYPRCEAVQITREEDYEATGCVGYFKVDVNDGKEWRLVLLNDIFPNGEHHFTKTECSIDTFGVCEEILKKMAGKRFSRTYREHYEPDEDETA